MSISKEKILAIGGSLIGISTGIAATVGQQLMDSGVSQFDSQAIIYAGTAIGGGIAVNLLSNVAQNICTSLHKKVLIKHPDQLNHNLQKALLSSVEGSIKNIMVLYKDKRPSGSNYEKVLAFAEAVEDTLKRTFTTTNSSSSYSYIHQYIRAPVGDIKSKILSDLKDLLNNTDLPHDFVQ